MGGEDIHLLKRRFKSFVGVSFRKDGGIENGAGRLNIPSHFQLSEDINKKNIDTMRCAADRKLLKYQWDEGLKKGISLVEEIKIPFLKNQPYKTLKKSYLNKTIANFTASLSFGLSIFFEMIISTVRQLRSMGDILGFLKVTGIIGFLLFGRLTLKTLLLYVKYRDLSKDIQKIGEVLLNSLIRIGVIKTESTSLLVVSSIDNDGAVLCHLDGGTSFERSAFINGLQEILAPIDNPRYFIIRKGILMRFFKQKDYHAVPEILSRNKASAEYFKNEWLRLVGPCDLIFARNIAGRKLLLKSRIRSFASQLENKTERVSKWRH